MSVSAYTFGRFHYNMQRHFISNLIDSNTVIRCVLLNNSYIPRQNRHDCFSAPVWESGKNYNPGDYIKSTTPNGHLYLCIDSGFSDSSEPGWPTTDGTTISDNGAEWECIENGDIGYYEISGTGYSAGGKDITGRSLSFADGSTYFDGSDLVWQSATFTASFAVVYDDTPGDDEAKKLIGYIDFGGERPVSSGDFKISWHTDGILATTAFQEA